MISAGSPAQPAREGEACSRHWSRSGNREGPRRETPDHEAGAEPLGVNSSIGARRVRPEAKCFEASRHYCMEGRTVVMRSSTGRFPPTRRRKGRVQREDGCQGRAFRSGQARRRNTRKDSGCGERSRDWKTGASYARRKAMVAPVNGQIKEARHCRRFLVRSL